MTVQAQEHKPAAQTSRLTGVVTNTNSRGAGYGWIEATNGERFFFHTNYVAGKVRLTSGSVVSFTPLRTAAEGKNHVALNVNLESLTG